MLWDGLLHLLPLPGMLAHPPCPGVWQVSGPGFLSTASLAALGLFLAILIGTICLRFLRRQRRRWRDIQTRLHLARSENAFLRGRLLGFEPLLKQIVLETDTCGQILFLAGPWQHLGHESGTGSLHPRTLEEWIHPADRPAFHGFFQSLLSGHQMQELEIRLQDRVGRCLSFTCGGLPILDGEGDQIAGLRFSLDKGVEKIGQRESGGERLSTEEILTLVLSSFDEFGDGQPEQALLLALDPVARLVGADVGILLCQGGLDSVSRRGWCGGRKVSVCPRTRNWGTVCSGPVCWNPPSPPVGSSTGRARGCKSRIRPWERAWGRTSV